MQNHEEATHIVYGDFTHSASELKTSKKTDKAVVTDQELLGLYVHYLTFTESADINFSGNIKVKKLGGNDIYSQKIGKSSKAIQKSEFVPAKSPLDVNKSINILSAQQANNSNNYGFMGLRVYNQTYNLAKIKSATKDKTKKKKIKSLNKNIKTVLKNNSFNVRDAGKYLLEILAVEESSAVKYNIGLCYLAIGNYSKAKEFLNASGISRINIDALIEQQQILKELGVNIIENDF